jgi:AraC family transcriptional regulator
LFKNYSPPGAESAGAAQQFHIRPQFHTGGLCQIDQARRFVHAGDRPSEQHALQGEQPANLTGGHEQQTVDVLPSGLASRSTVSCRGIRVELINVAKPVRISMAFRGQSHLLAAYERGVRRDGETHVEGLPRSRRRDLARMLTLVPAGRAYQEWHDLRSPLRCMFFHLNPAMLQAYPALANGMALAPRMFFEDATLWGTIRKLRGLIEAPAFEDRLYLEALVTVLAHELAHLDRAADRAKPEIRGGLAAWQQRAVTAYIDEHLGESISLATLAQLARLSPYHFCRTFKQSFGLSPHRYHTQLRIERAKTLLETHRLSVTEIGMSLGFSDASAFTAAFRKVTGCTPRSYHRTVA